LEQGRGGGVRRGEAGPHDDGGKANPYLDPKVKKLGLTAAEVHALVAFMEALTGDIEREQPLTVFPK